MIRREVERIQRVELIGKPSTSVRGVGIRYGQIDARLTSLSRTGFCAVSGGLISSAGILNTG